MEHNSELKERIRLGERPDINLKTNPGSWIAPVSNYLGKALLLDPVFTDLPGSVPDEVIALIEDSIEALPTGSYFTVSPRPENCSDIDIMLLVTSKTRGLETAFNLGAEVGTDYPCEAMHSVRIKEFNLLFTEDPAYFYRWAIATDIARRLNLTEKEDRAYLFERLTSM